MKECTTYDIPRNGRIRLKRVALRLITTTERNMNVAVTTQPFTKVTVIRLKVNTYVNNYCNRILRFNINDFAILVLVEKLTVFIKIE
jgi:hypothetical protein